ncbi:MAG: Fmu (Sun) protein [Sediminibacterium sp.]|nr:Fmu (Sun) protein [Sediminibacterium sp.]
MRFQSYFNTAIQLIRLYDGKMPLVYFLKQYFSQHKKHGSRDRKIISHLCYTYYRLGHALPELEPEERMRIAIFLCHETAGDRAILYEAEWLDEWNEKPDLRLAFVQARYPAFTIGAIFPWTDALDKNIDIRAFVFSHFIQPDLFLRIRPGNEQPVLKKLKDHQVPFEQTGSCITLPNATKIDTLLEIDKEVVVQDRSSQRMAGFLQAIERNGERMLSVWDCCAASGGKSILAYDTLQHIQLVASDIRASIIQNLTARLKRAGISRYEAFVADSTDLKSASTSIKGRQFGLLICDAPCSGSGTWGRTPEQLFFFTREKIAAYTALQQKILANVIPKVAAGGYLLYMTCSVFREENEDMVAFIETHANLQLIKMELLPGYETKADTMFAALFRAKDREQE